MSIQDAFHAVCTEAIEAKTGCFYVTLIRIVPFYGGPEEGGWFGKDKVVEAYQRFSDRHAAKVAFSAVKRLAKEMTDTAKIEHGQACIRQLAFCEARGIEDSNSVFGEDSGPDSYMVTITDRLPVTERGCRHYE